MTDVYDTYLTPDQESDYQSKFGTDASEDYDMRGYYTDNPGTDPNTGGQHYPDTYKKPWHPTFSDESMYNGVAGTQGGTWGTDTSGKDTFAPGKTNMQLHGLLGMMDYFDKNEPNVTLLMPK